MHVRTRARTHTKHAQALAQELGLALGCFAHVSCLRREALGGFSADDAWPLDVLLPTARRFKRAIRHGAPPAGRPGRGSQRASQRSV